MLKKFIFTLLLVHVLVLANSATIKTYDYNARDQVISITSDEDPGNPITFTYDQSGNRETKTQNGVTTEYKWSPRGRLAEVSRNGMWFARYQYDFNGLRISKQIRPVGKNIEETRFVYDGKRLVSETNVIGNVLVKYHWAEGRPLGETRNGKNYFYFLDALGSVVAITAKDGSVVARIEYDAFGNVRATQGSHVGLFGFTGYYSDDETGLYYAQQRYYDSELGAFISEDSFDGELKDPPSLHGYLYAKANPNKYVDRDGRCNMGYMDYVSLLSCEDHYEELSQLTSQQILDRQKRISDIELAGYKGIAQGVGNILLGAVETLQDIRGAGLEYRTGGLIEKGSILRLQGQLDATVDFVKSPVETVKTAFQNHQLIVAEMEKAGNYEGAAQERARFATTGLLSAGGGGLAGAALKNRFSRGNSLPVDPSAPNTDMTGIVTEGGGNNVELSSISNSTKLQRRTWQQSETQILNANPDFEPQISFIAGNQVKHGAAGSVRPEGFNFVTNTSIEVKNYNVVNPSNRSNLISNVVKQIGQRNQNLPSGANQLIHIDVHGQDVTPAMLKNIKNRIVDRSGIDPNNIFFTED